MVVVSMVFVTMFCHVFITIVLNLDFSHGFSNGFCNLGFSSMTVYVQLFMMIKLTMMRVDLQCDRIMENVFIKSFNILNGCCI